MDWERYKALCNRPEVVSRWLLAETLALVPESLRPPLRDAMAGTPLPKPLGHKGGTETDMFEVALDEHATAILAAVEAAAVRGATTSEGRGLGGFVTAWRELKERDV